MVMDEEECCGKREEFGRFSHESFEAVDGFMQVSLNMAYFFADFSV